MIRSKIELYFHIPFCVRKCLYCDFLSAPADAAVQNAYMEALLRETRERATDYRDYVVDTVFIGGGTPSVVSADWIGELLKIVKEEYTVAEDAEITMEVNPGTVDSDKLACYFRAGVNRLSIGLQSADNEELERLGRIHTWEAFLDTYDLARRVGFRNINVDVMSALPGQTNLSYASTLEKILDLVPQPEHISAYSLIVEEGTPFGDLFAAGSLQLPDEECERAMYEQTAAILNKHGFRRYEISNYAKEGYACRHNCGYWNRTDYVGFGIGAASLVENVRFQNDDNIQEYIRNPLGQRSDYHELSKEEQMEEFMFLGLRMTRGVSRLAFQQIFGIPMETVYKAVIEKNKKDGLLYDIAVCEKQSSEEEDRRLALTKRGMDLSNYVMAQFLLD